MIDCDKSMSWTVWYNFVMEIIRAKDAKIDFIISELEKGKVFAMPTDTSYGLVADTNKKTIKKIYEIKSRPREKEIPFFVSQEWISYFIGLNQNAEKLILKYWPGALTLIVRKGRKKIAVREPNNKLLLSIVSKYAKPLTSTSANISGEPACYSLQEINKQFSDKKFQPDYIIDGGVLPKKPASTIIDTETMQILRQGKIKPML